MSNMLDAEEVARELKVSKSSAYGIIKKCNAELKSLGYYVIRGRVNRQFFEKKFFFIGGEKNG